MSKTTQNPNIQDVIKTVNVAFTAVTVEMQEIKERLGRVETTVNTLPTKDYLDQKLATQKADIVQLVKGGDQKVVALVHELRDTKVVSAPAAKRILALKSFA